MPDSHSHESRRGGQTGWPVPRRGDIPRLVALACLSSLILLTACSERRETPSSEVLAASVAITPTAQAAHQTAGPTLDLPPPRAPTPPLLPSVVPAQEPAALFPQAPSAPPAEPAVPISDPVEAQAPGPAEAAALEAVVVATAAAVETPAPAPPAAGPIGSAALVDRVMELINAARRNTGLEPLRPAAALREAAHYQARAIADARRLTHTPPGGSSLERRMQAAGYDGWIGLAEVLAAGPASPEAVVALWLSSPEHRGHLLDPALTEFGGGHYYLSGSIYGHWWVADLGAR